MPGVMILEQRKKARNLIFDNQTDCKPIARIKHSNLCETVCKFEREETMCSSVDEKRMKSPCARARARDRRE